LPEIKNGVPGGVKKMGIKSFSLDHLVAWLQSLVAKLAGLGFWVNPGLKKGRKGVCFLKFAAADL